MRGASASTVTSSASGHPSRVIAGDVAPLRLVIPPRARWWDGALHPDLRRKGLNLACQLLSPLVPVEGQDR